MHLDRADLVIDLLYEAALEPAMWNVALERLADLVGGSSVSVLSSYHPDGGSHLLGSVHYDPENWRRVQLEHATPETNRYINLLNGARPGEVLWPRTLLTAKEWDEDPITLKFLRPDRLHDGLTVPFLQQDNAFLAAALFRGELYELEDVDVLRACAPDIRRALQVFRHLGKATEIQSATVEALDCLYTSVFLVDAGARVKHANASGHTALAKGDGIAINREGRLVVADRKGAETLTRLIAGANASATRGHRRWSPSSAQVAAGGTLALSRPSGAPPYSLLVAPLRRSTFLGMTVTSRTVSSVIFMADPDRRQPIDQKNVADAYRLTSAEANLVAHLIAGQDLHHAAQLMGMSVNSVKTLLQRSFDRTQTRRQSDLINLILRGPLGVAGSGHARI